MNEEKKETTSVKEEDVQLTKQDEEKVLNAIKKAHIDASKLNPETQEIFKEMMEKSKLPIVYENKDFKMGEQELDVRQLNRTNYRQLEFRQQVLENAYLRQIAMGQTDILRLLMVIADKLGVEDIVKATDDIIDKVDEQQEKKKNNEIN